MRSKYFISLTLLLSLLLIVTQHGCILFTFVGGDTSPMKTYEMPVNAFELVDAFDEYALDNKDKLERITGVHDYKTYRRSYFLLIDSLRATFSFYGDSTGFLGVENVSQLRLYYIKKGEKSFDADTKLNKKGKAELNLYVQKIESELIYPVREKLLGKK